MARILFLYSEMMPYMEAVLKELADHFGDQVAVISWDQRKLTPYQTREHNRVVHSWRSKFSNTDLIEYIKDYSPDLIYVSGRMDKGYLKAIMGWKGKIPVISGSDNQWKGSIKYRIARLFSYYLYRQYFTHIWVPGPLQYEFARRMGFVEERIIPNLYAGNKELFASRSHDKSKIKRIVFIGRLDPVKGLNYLVKAYQQLPILLQQEWQLLLIGEGKMRQQLEQIPTVRMTGFLSQEEMLPFLEGDCIFCLPSRKEPWGVVVHEMASAGLPLLVSDQVGAAKELLIEGWNGHYFKANSSASLHQKLMQLLTYSTAERHKMGENSRQLAERFSPRIAAASLRSVLK